MTIVGYEFPDTNEWAENYYDPNWLLIKFSMTNSTGTWTATTPCMLTWEFSRFADWLENIVGVQVPQRGFGFEFVEPDLRFKFTQDETGRDVLRVFVLNEDKLWADFPLEEVDFSEAALNLKNQLAKFPERLKE